MKKIKVLTLLLACTLIFTSCDTDSNTPKDVVNNTHKDTITTKSLSKPPHTAPPKGWTQNPDTDFDYTYNSELQGVEIRYIGTDPKVWFPTEFNGDKVVAIGPTENPDILEEVYIPEGIIATSQSAFSGCVNLESIAFPEGFKILGAHTFNNAPNLKNVILPNSLEDLEFAAFASCISLQDITIPDSVRNMGSSIFSGCTNLQNVKLPANLEHIGPLTFNDCTSLTQIELPSKLKSIQRRAFDSNVLTGLELPEGLEFIGELAFSESENLKEITLPSTITDIGYRAFYSSTKLDTIKLADPDAVMYIYANAFEDTYWYNKQPEGYVRLGASLLEYKGDVPTTMVVPDGIKSIVGGGYGRGLDVVTQVILPDSTKVIGHDAFSQYSNLENVNIPNSVEIITNGAFPASLKLNDATKTQVKLINPLATGREQYDSRHAGYN